MRSTSLRALVCILFVAILAGCAAPVVRTPEVDRSVKSVAVISLLDEQTRVERIGLTVFNNKAVVVDQTGSLNSFAIDTIEESLRKSRPTWQLKDARGEVPAMLAAKKAAGTSWTSQVSAFQKELAGLANKLDADLLFVVVDFSLENSPGRGVGVRLRTMSLSTVKDATVHSVCLVALVDRNGNEVTNRWGGRAATFATIPAADLGLDYDLSAVGAPETREKLKSSMRERLRASLTAAATGMGY